MTDNTVSILCSGVALGVYIPALLTDYQLRELGVKTELLVLENLLKEDKRKIIRESKKAFHGSFRVALAGQKMARDLKPNFDSRAVYDLFKLWDKENRRRFIVFSGFWLSVLKEYCGTAGQEGLCIEIVHMDAAVSASWKLFMEESKAFNNIWIFGRKGNNLAYEIPVGGKKPEAYGERPDRYVIHGGGWGMGTYQGRIPELTDMGFNLDIVAYYIEEALERVKGRRYYMVDPEWQPWTENSEGRYEFPPFGEIGVNINISYKNKTEYHELFDVIRKSRAVISKPGGATLMDSLASATPLVMLEPFGDYERKNSELWEGLGYGIPYEKWKSSGFSSVVLEKLHKNLMKAGGKLVNYPRDYFERNFK